MVELVGPARGVAARVASRSRHDSRDSVEKHGGGGHLRHASIVEASHHGEHERTLFKVEQVSKQFDGVHALSAVDAEFKAGRIHAVVGENGAGKSTLVKIIAGVHAPDQGTLYLDGSEVSFATPRDAMNASIAVVYQEPTLVPMLLRGREFGSRPRANRLGTRRQWQRAECGRYLATGGWSSHRPDHAG